MFTHIYSTHINMFTYTHIFIGKETMSICGDHNFQPVQTSFSKMDSLDLFCDKENKRIQGPPSMQTADSTPIAISLDVCVYN